jgi:hypothetical protein
VRHEPLLVVARRRRLPGVLGGAHQVVVGAAEDAGVEEDAHAAGLRLLVVPVVGLVVVVAARSEGLDAVEAALGELVDQARRVLVEAQPAHAHEQVGGALERLRERVVPELSRGAEEGDLDDPHLLGGGLQGVEEGLTRGAAFPPEVVDVGVEDAHGQRDAKKRRTSSPMLASASAADISPV